MFMKNSVEKPKNRSRLRRVVGKEFFCLKRKTSWYFNNTNWAGERDTIHLPEVLTIHRSFLLRPLKDVDMYLQHNKTKNLEIAISKINGIVIKPGETFSFWKLVGRPTRRKGYLDGLVLSNGQIGKGVGGGLCQLGNLIYWMTLHTPLTVKQRWRHSYDVFPDVNRKIPFGSGATLSYNYIDLQIKNETTQPYQINLWLEDEYVKGNIATSESLNSTYRIYELNHKFELQWWGGYTRHNQIWREIKRKDSEDVKQELVTENHAIMMYNPLVEAQG